jgi:hypothetical protein
MAFETMWRELRNRCEALASDAVLVTPSSGRAFSITSPESDRIVVRFLESETERSLWRDQFEVLYDRLERDSAGISTADLPSGVEPYVSVLSLAPQYEADESDNAVRAADGTTGESPYLRREWEVRTTPERVHDDALLLSDLLERHDTADLESLSPEVLVDLYVLLSDVQRGADRFRKSVGDAVLEYIGPDDRLHSHFGTVRRTTREYRRLKAEETVLAALDAEEIPREWVLGVDPDKLDVVLAATDLDERAVYDVDEQVYVQKTSVEEAEKQSRLQGLKDRLAALDGEEGTELREEIEDLEDRIDAALAAD